MLLITCGINLAGKNRFSYVAEREVGEKIIYFNRASSKVDLRESEICMQRANIRSGESSRELK